MSWSDLDVMDDLSHLTDEEREILQQAVKPYGSVDERYLRDWLLDVLKDLDEALGKLKEYGDALEGQGQELENVLSELGKAGWHGPASPGVEWLQGKLEALEEAAEQARNVIELVQRWGTFDYRRHGEIVDKLCAAKAALDEALEGGK